MIVQFDGINFLSHLLTPEFHKAMQDGWGRSVVKALSEYILSQKQGNSGYFPQNICRMKQFFETYFDKPGLGTLLRENTWSNKLHIMSKAKSNAG